jgi:hypothetical protein
MLFLLYLCRKKIVEHFIASGLSLFGANTLFAVVSLVSVTALPLA